MTLKEEILALDDRKVVEVEVPEWGGRKIRLMELSASDRDAWELQAYEDRAAGKRTEHVRARLVARSIVNGQGEREFADDAIEALGRKSAKALDRLYDAALKLNAIGKAEQDEIEKN